MSGKEALIDKILLDAKEQTDVILSEAKAKAEEIVAEARSYAEEMKSSEIEKAEASREDIVKRKVTVANLEVRKIILSAKQQVINEAFNEAMKKLGSLKPADYKKLIMGMLKAEAKDGDIVTVSYNDKDIITAAFIADAAKKLNIKLKYSDKLGEFGGGIILSSGIYDKNLTFEVELNMLRDEIEPEIANMIFGEVK